MRFLRGGRYLGTPLCLSLGLGRSGAAPRQNRSEKIWIGTKKPLAKPWGVRPGRSFREPSRAAAVKDGPVFGGHRVSGAQRP